MLAYLRSLMQHRSRIALILGGTNRLVDDFWTLLYNAAESRELGPLSKSQTERLIREPVQPQINFDDLVVERIWRLTGGHPYLTQLVCNRLLAEINADEVHPNLITQSHLSKVMSALLKDDDGYLLALWENTSEDAKGALAATAACVREAGLPISSSDIARRLGLRPDDEKNLEGLLEALEELNSRRLLLRVPKTFDIQSKSRNGNHASQDQSDGEIFLFAFDLLRLWVMENHPFAEELSILARNQPLSSPF